MNKIVEKSRKTISEKILDLLNKIRSSKDSDDLQLLESYMMDSNVRLEIMSVLKEINDGDLKAKDFKTDNIDKLFKDMNFVFLKSILQAANTIYNYSGENTGISDSEYDILVEFYREIINKTGEQGKLDIITEPLINTNNDDETYFHKFPSLRGTLDKIYKITDEDVLHNQSQKSLEDWIKSTTRKYIEKTGENIDLYKEDIYVMPKYDGVSCIFEFDDKGNMIRALTRGDTSTNEAQNITHVFQTRDYFGNGVGKGPIINPGREYGIKTEIMMKSSDLDEYNEKFNKTYKNTRSIVSSILNSDEIDQRVNYLKVIPLRLEFEDDETQEIPNIYFTYPILECKLKDLDEIHDFAIKNKYVHFELRCDGAVIYFRNKELQKILGRENHKNKYEVAFKFTEETAYVPVRDIEFTVGKYGNITPVAIFKDVKMKGNQVSRASLGSYDRFNKLHLSRGDVLKITYDIIPYADFEEDDPCCIRNRYSDEFKTPVFCPECHSKLVLNENGKQLLCQNSSCPCRERGKILTYLQKLKISNISYATISDFYREGYIRSIQDIYSLKVFKKELENLSGYGKLKISKILHEIDSHKEVTPSQLFASIGIPGLSNKTFQKILQYITYEELLEFANSNNADFFTVIPGIKIKTAEKLVEGIKDNKKLISFLLNELTILPEPNTLGSHYRVLFTKVRDTELENWIKTNHGEVLSSFRKDCNLVIVPKLGITSGKIKEAEKNEIPIVEISKAKDYIKKNFI